MALTYTLMEEGYRILNDGEVWIVQEGYCPYPEDTLEESALNHIRHLEERIARQEEWVASEEEED